MKKIKVFIVDDHEMFREGVKMLLSKSPDFEIVGEAQNGKECIENLPSDTDVILMDISMPEMNGIEATQKLTGMAPSSKIIALSMFGDEEYYYKMIHAGVSGFVLKEAGSKEMEEAIREVCNGGNFFSQELLRNVVVGLGENKPVSEIGKQVKNSFTEMEIAVLQQYCSGSGDEEIAGKLQLSADEMEQCRAGLFKKTSTKDTVSLILFALRNNIVMFS